MGTPAQDWCSRGFLDVSALRLNRPIWPILITLHSLRDQEQFADFTIICGAEEYKVHRVVISSRSRYFRSACSRNFKEGDSARIELQGEDEEIIGSLVHYLHHLEIDVPESRDLDESIVWPRSMQETVFYLIDLFIAADKYEVQGLVDEVCVKLERILWNNCRTIAPDTTLRIIEQVCLSTVRGSALREVVQNYILSCDMNKALKESGSEHILLKSHPDFVYDTFKMLVEQTRPKECDKKGCKGILVKSIVQETCKATHDGANTWYEANERKTNENKLVRSFLSQPHIALGSRRSNCTQWLVRLQIHGQRSDK